VHRSLPSVVLLAAVLALAACGGDDDGSSDVAATPSATRGAASSTPAPADTPVVTAAGDTPVPPAPTATPPAATPTSAPRVTQPVTLALSAFNAQFEQSALAAAAGSDVTVQFANRDNGIPHNVHFFAGPNASSTSLAASTIQPGPVEEALALGELAAGAYYYKCDVHASMEGTLTVS
jgi:plastocyanin